MIYSPYNLSFILDRSQTIEITGSTIIRSHAALETMGITLLVRPGAHLTIKAPAINMQKSKASAHQGEKISLFQPLQRYSRGHVPAPSYPTYTLRSLPVVRPVNFAVESSSWYILLV